MTLTRLPLVDQAASGSLAGGCAETADSGVLPKVVSERLGHATIAITLDTYSHATLAMQEETAALIADLAFVRWVAEREPPRSRTPGVFAARDGRPSGSTLCPSRGSSAYALTVDAPGQSDATHPAKSTATCLRQWGGSAPRSASADEMNGKAQSHPPGRRVWIRQPPRRESRDCPLHGIEEHPGVQEIVWVRASQQP